MTEAQKKKLREYVQKQRLSEKKSSLTPEQKRRIKEYVQKKREARNVDHSTHLTEAQKRKIREYVQKRRKMKRLSEQEVLVDANAATAAPATVETTATTPNDPFTPPAPGMIPSGWIKPEDLAAAVAQETGDMEAASTAEDVTATTTSEIAAPEEPELVAESRRKIKEAVKKYRARKARMLKESEEEEEFDELKDIDEEFVEPECEGEECEIEPDVNMEVEDGNLLSQLEAFFDDASEGEVEEISDALRKTADFLDILTGEGPAEEEAPVDGICPECGEDPCVCDVNGEMDFEDTDEDLAEMFGDHEPEAINESKGRVKYNPKNVKEIKHNRIKARSDSERVKEAVRRYRAKKARLSEADIKYPAGSGPEVSNIVKDEIEREEKEALVMREYKAEKARKERRVRELREYLKESRNQNPVRKMKENSIDKFDAALRARGTSRVYEQKETNDEASWANNKFIDKYNEKLDFKKILNEGLNKGFFG